MRRGPESSAALSWGLSTGGRRLPGSPQSPAAVRIHVLSVILGFWTQKNLHYIFLMLPYAAVLGRSSCARSGMSSWVRRGPSCCGRAWCRVPYRLKVTQIWCFFPFLVREQLKELTKQYEKSENDLKALQSVGQVCGRNGGRAACGGG